MKIQSETQNLIDMANEYRRRDPGYSSGYVLIHNMKTCGWTQSIGAHGTIGWMPGTWAIDALGNKWLAIGGNDYDGAESWQSIPHDTFAHDNL